MNIPTFIKVLVIVFVLVASSITIYDEVQSRLAMKQMLSVESSESTEPAELDENSEPFSDPSCSVAAITVHGDIYTYYDIDMQAEDDAISGEDVMYYLSIAEETPHVETIFLEIDSYGGSPVAAEEIANLLQQYVTKPVVAQIRGGGTSAAYWIASASDYIFASALSDVGGIGVTMSYIDEGILNEREGYTYNNLSSGKFKDSGSSQKSLTEDERVLFQRDVDIIHEVFVKSVADNRNMDIQKVRDIADGSSMLGEMAKEKGLIDAVGGYFEAWDYIDDTYTKNPVVCW